MSGLLFSHYSLSLSPSGFLTCTCLPVETLPRVLYAVLLQVVATDPDTERPNDIEYSLNGPLAEDNTFTIDKKTGDISLLRRLDRDLPDGQEVFEFNVLAVDEPRSQNKRTGVSFVRVKPIDINDNPPRFDKNLIEGSVPEHSTGSGKWLVEQLV